MKKYALFTAMALALASPYFIAHAEDYGSGKGKQEQQKFHAEMKQKRQDHRQEMKEKMKAQREERKETMKAHREEMKSKMKERRQEHKESTSGKTESETGD